MSESKERYTLNDNMIAGILDALLPSYPNTLKAEVIYQSLFEDFHKAMDDDPDWLLDVKVPLDEEYDFNLNFLMEHGYIQGFRKAWGCLRRVETIPHWRFIPPQYGIEDARYVDLFRISSKGILYRTGMKSKRT